MDFELHLIDAPKFAKNNHSGPNAPPPKRGPVSYRATTEIFRSAGHRTQIQQARNELRSDECLGTHFSERI